MAQSNHMGRLAEDMKRELIDIISHMKDPRVNGLLTVTYEDEKGNAKTLTKEFSMTVEEMQMGGDDTMGGGMDTMVPMEPEPTGVPVWVWIVVGVGVVAAVVVVLVVLKKKKAKRRAAQLMEDDDEDI